MTYQPKLARFLSRDPLLEDGSMLLTPMPDMREIRGHRRPYAYVDNRPTYFVDPSGMEEELATTDEILNNTKADGTTTLYLCVESIPSTGTVGGHVSIVIDTSGNGTSGVLIEGMPRDVESTCTDKITAPKQLLGEIDLLDEEKLEAVKDDVLRSIGNVTLPKVGTRACLQYIGLATNPRTVLSQMFEKARAIRGCCHNYDFLSEGAEAGYNSNAFAYTLMKLVEAHIEEGLPEKLVEVPVTPGWGQEIPDCDAAENGDRC